MSDNLLILADNLAAAPGATVTPTPALAAQYDETGLVAPIRGAFARTTGLADQALVVDFTDLASGGLITNPDFEVDTAGWSVANGSPTFARVTSAAFAGGACLEITSSGSALERVGFSVTGPLLTQGAAYFAAARFRQGNAAAAGEAGNIAILETGGAQANAALAGGNGSLNYTLDDTWQQVTASGTIAQTDRTGIELRVGFGAGSESGDKVLVDGVQVFVGASVPAFDQLVDYLVLARNNLTDAATVRLRAYSDAGAAGDVLADSGWQPAHLPGTWRATRLRDSWLRLASVVDARSVQIDISDAGNPDGYLQIGWLGLGQAIQLSGRDNIDWDTVLTFDDATQAQRLGSDDALHVATPHAGFRTLDLGLSWAQEQDRGPLADALRRLGRHGALWVNPYPNAGNPQQERDHAMLARVAQAAPMRRLRTRRTGVRLRLEEW